MPSTPQSVADALRTMLHLFETGIDLMRQNLRRSHPDADDEEIERRREHQTGVTSLEEALRQIQTDLIAAHVPFALVGGLAVSERSEPRFTRDADLAVALASDAEAEALIHTLRGRDYGIEAMVEQEAVGRLATVRLTRSTKLQAPVIDLCSLRRESSPRSWPRPSRFSCCRT